MEINIRFGDSKAQSIKLNNYGANLNGNLTKALQKSGALVESNLKRELTSRSNSAKLFAPSSHGSRLASRTGYLARSISHQMVANGMGVQVGPHAPYAAIHEFGGKIQVTDKMRRFLHAMGVHLRKATKYIKIPARPWFKPTWEKARPSVVNIFRNQINGPLK